MEMSWSSGDWIQNSPSGFYECTQNGITYMYNIHMQQLQLCYRHSSPHQLLPSSCYWQSSCGKKFITIQQAVCKLSIMKSLCVFMKRSLCSSHKSCGS